MDTENSWETQTARYAEKGVSKHARLLPVSSQETVLYSHMIQRLYYKDANQESRENGIKTTQERHRTKPYHTEWSLVFKNLVRILE